MLAARVNRKRKLSIKAFDSLPELPEGFVDGAMQRMKEAMDATFEGNASSWSIEGLYSQVETLCIHGRSENLYRLISSKLECYVKTIVKQVEFSSDSELLAVTKQLWEGFCSKMNTLSCMFMYLDRSFVLQATAVRSLRALALQVLRRQLSASPTIGTVYSKLLELISIERGEGTIDRILAKTILQMLVELNMYENGFEKSVLVASAKHYTQDSRKHLEKLDTANYLLYVEKRLAEEQDRATAYLAERTLHPLTRLVQNRLITGHIETLLRHDTFSSLAASSFLDKTDISRLYSLLGKVNKLAALAKAFELFIVRTGSSLVSDGIGESSTVSQRARLVPSLIELKRNVESVVATAFSKSESMATVVKRSFEEFLNESPDKPSEALAEYIDRKLKSVRKDEKSRFHELLADAIFLFRYQRAKDVFQIKYRELLAERLLSDSSCSPEHEQAAVRDLKKECGSSYVVKFEAMFKDMETSRMQSFDFNIKRDAMKRKLFGEGANLKAACEISVRVLTTNSWPSYPELEVKLPKKAEALQEAFRVYYVKKFNGRKLTWQPYLTTCVISANFAAPVGSRELVCSAAQASVLLQFKGQGPENTLSMSQLQEATELSQELLSQTIDSLTDLSRTPILVSGVDLGFFINKELSASTPRTLLLNSKSTGSIEAFDDPQISKKVFKDRAYSMDAKLVRLMKIHKTITHSELMEKLASQVVFPFVPADAKKRIENLIDREYMERDDKNHELYHYLP